jgi:hypothetical protein
MTAFKFPAGVLAQHTAVLGKTGSGKTSTAKLMVEQVVAGDARVCVLDPIKSDWWGLTSSADGKRAGLPFQILGGPRGHVPLHSSSGKAIGEIVASGALPLSIIDMADFEPGGQAKFFVDFAPTLIRKMRGVVYLVMEEAHLFAPKERSGIGSENMSIHWAKTMATAGRSKGIRLILVTQRTQALHNALLGSCETMIAHRMSAPADQEPVVKWLKANTDKATTEKVASSLSSIPTGSGWLCSGEEKIFELVKFPRIHTYDNSATPTGDAAIGDIKTAAVDPERLRAIIGDAVKTAEANDPAALKKQIAELQRQIKATPAAAEIDPKQWKEDVVQSHKEGVIAGQQSIVDQLEVYYGSLESWSRGMPRPPVFKLDAVPMLRRPAEVPHKSGNSPVNARQSSPAKVPHNGDARLSRPQQVILDQLAVLKDREIYPASRATLAAFCKVSPSSSGYEKNLSTLKTLGMIAYPRQGEVAFTLEGEAAAAAPFDDGTPAADFWLAIVNEPKAKILRALIDEHPTAMARVAIAQKADVSENSSGFEKNLSQLKTLGAIEYPMSGVVALTRYVMP